MTCFQIYHMRALLILVTEEFGHGVPGFAKQGNDWIWETMLFTKAASSALLRVQHHVLNLRHWFP